MKRLPSNLRDTGKTKRKAPVCRMRKIKRFGRHSPIRPRFFFGMAFRTRRSGRKFRNSAAMNVVFLTPKLRP